MRYSRFRQQMEGTAAPKVKRKPKKAKVVDPPVEMQTMFPTNPPLMPAMGLMDPSFQSNPFIKREPGTQGSLTQGPGLYSPQSIPDNNMQGQYYYPHDFASTQFQLATKMPSMLSSSGPPTSSSINPYLSEAMPTSYPYSSSVIHPSQSCFEMPDIGSQMTCPNPPSDTTWDRQGSSSLGGPMIKSEELQSDSMMNWESLPSFQQSIATAVSEEQQHHNPIYNWGPQPISRQDSPPTTSVPRDQTIPSSVWESQTLARQRSPVIKSEQQQPNPMVVWEPTLPPSQNVPVSQSNEQMQINENRIWAPLSPSPQHDPVPQEKSQSDRVGTWVSMPPSPHDTPPAEVEVQEPSNALVLWRPLAQSQPIAPVAQADEQRITNLETTWQPGSPAQQGIPVVYIDVEDGEGMPGVIGGDSNPQYLG